MLKKSFFSHYQPFSLLLHLISVKKGVFFVSLMPLCIINTFIYSLSLFLCIVSVLNLLLTLLMTLKLILGCYILVSAVPFSFLALGLLCVISWLHSLLCLSILPLLYHLLCFLPCHLPLIPYLSTTKLQ